MLGMHPEEPSLPERITMEKTNLPQPNGRPVDPRSEPLLLRPAEAARFLAISPRKLWELTNCREVPAIRIGRALRYPTEELRNWVAERRGR
jgi:excisionase family DNA binding protein